MKCLGRSVFLLAAAATTLVAQSPTPAERAVRAVVDSFFDAVAREKWDSAATFIDLARFEPYFRQTIGNARSALPQPPMTVEQIMARDSTMPRAAAEYELAQMQKHATMRPGFGDMSYEFAGVHSQQELFALQPAQALARWLEAQDMRTQEREAWRQSGCSLSPLPQFPAMQHTVIGIAISNDSTAYVVHTNADFGSRGMPIFSHEQVMPVHRVGADWRIEPRIDLIRPGAMGFSFSECPKTRR